MVALAHKHLGKDARLKKLISQQGPLEPGVHKNLCYYLCCSIMSQQLSTQVAKVFRKRFLSLYGNRVPAAARIAATSFETLKGIGLSNAKASYILQVAEFATSQGLQYPKLQALTDEEVIAFLVQIKGVGRWTAEMVLMFALGRPDVFPVDDLGIQKAMQQWYQLDGSNIKILKNEMTAIAESWRPYRTTACLHLWRLLDGA